MAVALARLLAAQEGKQLRQVGSDRPQDLSELSSTRDPGLGGLALTLSRSCRLITRDLITAWPVPGIAGFRR